MNTIEELLRASEGIRQALLNNDAAALGQLLAEDYCGFDPKGGKQDRATVIQAYSPGGVQLDTYETADVTARVLGEVGLVMGVGTLSGRYGEHQFEHRVRFLDVYVHRDSAWRLYVSQITEI